jgi:FADH2 O2-dependent halogenase
MPNSYDCVIIGAGIAGSISALVLAQMGLQVLVVEAGTHPRFAIGESFVPTTTLGLDYLAKTYNIPELRQISHYPELREIGLAGWPKLGFSFCYHHDGRPLEPGNQMMFTSPGLPIGPDVHILRSDIDHFLVSRFGAYGVAYQDRTTVAEFSPEPDEVKLGLDTAGRLAKVHTRFVLDCSGHNSFLAGRLDLRQRPAPLRTNTRTIFSHFQDVLLLEEVLKNPGKRFHLNRDAGTIHHCFEGGWFWVIRFDNGLTSVGLTLDRDTYPDNDQPAETEFCAFLRRFPLVEAQLGSARPIRPFVKTGRIQFVAHTIAGDRYLLAPHAAGFVDPLFSTGVDLTTAFVIRAAPLIQRMLADDHFSVKQLQPLQRWYAAEISTIDLIVHGMYRALRHGDILKQYWRCWIFISLVQYFTQFASDPLDELGPLGHYSAAIPRWHTQLKRMYHRVTDTDARNPATVAATLKALMDNFPEPFDRECTNWTIGSTEPCSPIFDDPLAGTEWFQRLLDLEPTLAQRVKVERLVKRQERLQAASDQLVLRYLESKMKDTGYHHGVDFIRAQQL